jgi:crotonobetainyl-CoA:carnitine CoA-transferase CaiB-like acyl-CoA transferase
MQAFGGIMSVVGEEGRPPVRVGPSVVDVGTALWAVIGILAKLNQRKGGVVDVSLLETAAAWMNMYAAQYLASGELPKRNGSGQAAIVPYRAYRTRDGDLVVAAGNNNLFRRLCGVLGHSEWADDARFRDNPDRVKHAATLYGLIEAEMAKRTSAEWSARLDDAGVPCAPVQNVQQLMAHEQFKALGLLQEVPGASIAFMGLPISFDGSRPEPGTAAPALGAHTKEIL